MGYEVEFDHETRKAIVKKDGVVVHEETEEVERVGGDLRISFSLSRKLSLQHYGGLQFESAEAFVSVTAPSSTETIDDDYESVKAWVEFRLGEVVGEITGSSSS